MRPPFCERRAPPWWPAGEPWPPSYRGRGMDPRVRARFFRRAAIGAATVFFLIASAIVVLMWTIAGRSGPGTPAAAILALVMMFAVAIALVTMFGAMRRFGSPLSAVMDAADRVADGDYGVRVREYGPPPIRALARSFNAMTERLEKTDRLRRDLMADVAHELRTPLSVLQGRLELVDGVYPRDDAQLAEIGATSRIERGTAVTFTLPRRTP